MFYMNYRAAAWALPVVLVIALAYPFQTQPWLWNMAFLEPERWQQSSWAQPGAQITFAMRLTYFAVWLVPQIVSMIGFVAAVWLLWQVIRKDVFARGMVRGLQILGLCVLGSSLTHLLAASVSPMIVSWANTDGPLPLRFWYSTEHGGLILCGLGFLLIASILHEAARIRDENKGFI